jgi:hypothetical protein
MKKNAIIYFLLFFLCFQSFQINANQPPPVFGISITFTTKAYWDGTQCFPRERGCCIHIEFSPNPGPGQIAGEVSYSDQTGLVLTTSKKKGLLPETFNKLFQNGKFILDGEGTLSQDLLNRLKLKAGFRIPEGKYPYTVKDDMITITFKQ